MNKLITLLIISILSINITAQSSVDLTIVKPIINFNDSTGGYYSNLFYEQFNGIFAGAIVKNNGTDTATNVFLKVTNLNSPGFTAYSDSIASIAPGKIDTVKMFFIPKPNNFQNYGSINPKYELLSDQSDINPSDNIYTIPISSIYTGAWTYISRSKNDNKCLKNANGLQSGDFIGIKIKLVNNGLNFYPVESISLDQKDLKLPDSSFIIGKVYYGDSLIAYTDSIFYKYPSCPYTFISPSQMINPPVDSIIAGFEVHFKDSIPNIKIDTSVFHNFNSESFMRRNGQWSNLNYIPLVSMLFFTMEIEESEKALPMKVYPNPTTDFVTLELDKINSLTVYDINGKEVYSTNGKNIDNKINIKNLTSGIYFIKAVTDENTYLARVIKQP